jgi:uncharacterized pyridoxal phosphate-containing UPF0001 family protein
LLADDEDDDPMNVPSSLPPRAADPAPDVLHARLQAVRSRIASAARGCGRDPAAVRLLAVSKTFDAQAVLALAECGQHAFGENYLQEALTKMASCATHWQALAGGRSGPAAGRPGPTAAPIEWHFIGPIQSNKTRPIAEAFDWVHSVEREKVARRLSEQRPASMPPLQVCIQVDVSGESTKSGCTPDDAIALARAVSALAGLRLRGVMAIPAPTDDPALQRAQFARVRAVFDRIRADGIPIDTLSMGMSGDLEAAIAEGATIVRIGTALFGTRPVKSTDPEGN